MLLRLLCPFALLILSVCCHAQDTLYMRDGRIIDCEIESVDSSFIYFKQFEQRQGNLALSKNLVRKIRYAGGAVERLQLPKTNKGPGSTILSIAVPSLNLWGLGAGITCEIPLIRNKLTLFLPFYFTGISYGDIPVVRIRHIMPAIKFYPGRRIGRSKERYAIGLQYHIQNGYYRAKHISSGGNSSFNNYDAYGESILLSNSINFYPTRHLYIGVDLAGGPSLTDNIGVIHLNASVGYRF